MSWNRDYSVENNEQTSSHQLRMRSLIEAEEYRKEAFLRPLEFLVEDICETGLKVSLKEAINHFKYPDATEEAKACLAWGTSTINTGQNPTYENADHACEAAERELEHMCALCEIQRWSSQMMHKIS